MAKERDQHREWYDLLRRYGLQAEFDLAVERWQEEHPGKGWREAFKAVRGTFSLPQDDGAVDRTTGKRSYLQDAEWAYQNLDRAESMGMDEAPSAGAWSLLQRAHRDPSVLDSPMMLLAKRQQADAEEQLIRKDLERMEAELQGLIEKLLSEPL
jgi:hypothetical protein